MVKVSFGAPKTKTAKTQAKSLARLVGSRNAALVTGAFVGVAASLPLSVAFLAPTIASELASNNTQPVTMRAADDNLACVAPAGTTAGGPSTQGKTPTPQKKHENYSYSPTPAPKSPQKQYITKLVGGTFASNNSVNENNNSPNGKAISVNTNIITNTNSSVESNATDQSANSGNVVSAGNNGASGNAASGNTANQNSTSLGTYQNN